MQERLIRLSWVATEPAMAKGVVYCTNGGGTQLRQVLRCALAFIGTMERAVTTRDMGYGGSRGRWLW